eukprot:TRINITY_DN7753_c0_g1_i2.p1 TRINITY_DN7753_c0_g1~~TRINITY_DN7753_c0_g1_i2.p1  ORF type:complete len:740 (-),score=156.30 TRINITY_DN7753_c0_g1_i2:106-2325(-)
MMEALGVEGVAFSRIPGACDQGVNHNPPGVKSASEILMDRNTGGIDFTWIANDGSTTFAHWLPGHYCAGDNIACDYCYEYSTPEQLLACNAQHMVTSTNDHIQQYINTRAPISPTSNIYVPIGCDFSMPVHELSKIVNKWNSEIYPTTKTFAIIESFAFYVDLVNKELKEKSESLLVRNYHGTSPETSFRPSPYWTGFYASRMGLKIRHYEATRTLLGSEILSVIHDGLKLRTNVNEKLFDIWNDLSPSTHHDYITGTATDYVFNGEQKPLLEKVLKNANILKRDLLEKLKASISVEKDSVLVYNQLGFDRTALVEYDLPKNIDLTVLKNVKQISYNGKGLSIEHAPSLGYQTSELKSQNNEKIQYTFDGDCYTFENKLLSAQVCKSTNWGIKSFIDSRTNQNALSSIGNELKFYYDGGNIYRFGFENENCEYYLQDAEATPGEAEVLEKGPIRFRIRSSVSYNVASGNHKMIFDYQLVVGEPFLRINVTGSSPYSTSVTTNFPLRDDISKITHGTPYHYDTKKSFAFSENQHFNASIEATHNFVFAENSKKQVLAAVYHGSTPAWSYVKDTIVGVIGRNTPGSGCEGKGADGTDDYVHSILYTLRVPSGLSSDASSGKVLKEALSYNTPLSGTYLSKNAETDNSAPDHYSLASVSGNSIITTAKNGDFDDHTVFFRIYNPRTPKNITLTVDSGLFGNGNVRAYNATALERIASPIQSKDNTVSLNAQRALYTIGIKKV